jgi:GxxExxY protein
MSYLLHQDLSNTVLGLAFAVHNTLGPGLLEAAYEAGMCWELKHAGIRYERQKVFPLRYKGDLICSYTADLVVDDKIILELKAVQELNSVMFAQLINYLRLSGVPIGYLINFNKQEVSWRRFSIDPNN